MVASIVPGTVWAGVAGGGVVGRGGRGRRPRAGRGGDQRAEPEPFEELATTEVHPVTVKALYILFMKCRSPFSTTLHAIT